MVDERALSAVLSEFARTLVIDLPAQGVLDHFVSRIADVMPVSSAGATLISESRRLHPIAASDEGALRFERLQSDLSEGPCLAAWSSGKAVLIPDLAVATGFPQFAPAACRAGLAAVFTFPVRHGRVRLGALDLYSTTQLELDAREIAVAQDLADVAGAYVLNAQAHEDLRLAAERLGHDPLTGLPNRVLLQDTLHRAATRANRWHTSAALIFVNIEDFRQVNEDRGVRIGDALLVAVADRLQRTVGRDETLARVGGNEFAVLAERLLAGSDVELIVQRLRGAFEKPFSAGHAEIPVTVRITAINAIGTDYARGAFYSA